MTLLLGCANSMSYDTSNVAVADFALPGLAFGVLLIHEARIRRLSPAARSAVLLVTTVGLPVVASGFGFHLRSSPMGVATVPLLALLSGWLHLRERLFPALARRERGLPEPAPTPVVFSATAQGKASRDEAQAAEPAEDVLQRV